jgi:protein SCO1
MSNKKTKTRYILGLAVALLLPLSFYLAVKLLKKDQIYMPGYFIKEGVEERVVEGKKVYDTVYHQVSDLQLTNQLGQQISVNKDLAGKILIVDFFFVNCPSICPKLTANMKLMQRAFKKMDSVVHLVSITVNPERDTAAILRAYADRHGANHDHWWFLTGEKKKIYDFARNELQVYMQPGDGGADDFIHTEKIVVIDRERYIRGYYNGLDSADLKRCADDIILLIMEKKNKRK